MTKEEIRQVLRYASQFIGHAACHGEKCRLPHCVSCYDDEAESIDWGLIRSAIEGDATDVAKLLAEARAFVDDDDDLASRIDVFLDRNEP